MDKNLLWAVTLSIGIYALWFGVIEKRYIKPVPIQPARWERTMPPGSPAPALGAPAVGSANPNPAEIEVVDRATLESEAQPLPAAHAATCR